jgi:F-type H+-transporting ATPase subunit gamma
MESTRRYADALARITGHLLQAASDTDHPLQRATDDPERVTLVLMTADRGMCGAYNNHILNTARQYVEQVGADKVELVCIGKKGRDFARKRGWTILSEHIELQGKVQAQLMAEITDMLVERFLAGDTDRVMIAYNTFVNMMRYDQRLVEFLPLDPQELLAEEEGAEAEGGGGTEMIFEPDAETVFGVVLERYLRVRMVTNEADALTAEHSARMLAMSNATDNCDELMETLTLQLNKARQAAITKELLEIVSGAEALEG